MTDIARPTSKSTDTAESTTFRVGRARIGDVIERELCDSILSGRYQAGERLSPSALAQEFDVSPMPVREALVALYKAGLVELIARRGFRVAHISWRDVEDAFAVQAFTTGRLAAYAADVITPDDVERLRALQVEIEEAADGEPDAPHIETLNYEFHRAINHLSDAKHLRQFLRVATGVIPRQLHALIPGWIEATVGAHPQIIDALAAHDAGAARELAEAHVKGAGDLVLQKLARDSSREEEGPTVTALPVGETADG